MLPAMDVRLKAAANDLHRLGVKLTVASLHCCHKLVLAIFGVLSVPRVVIIHFTLRWFQVTDDFIKIHCFSVPRVVRRFYKKSR